MFDSPASLQLRRRTASGAAEKLEGAIESFGRVSIPRGSHGLSRLPTRIDLASQSR
jgi:hypothetical protein